MAGPLDGIRIIDLSQLASGPFATMHLADQGADVIKVEPPGLGDAMRAFPSYAKGGIAAVVIGLNRGKRSLCIDLSDQRGVAVIRRLAADADVFLQNFRPGVIERLGLDPADLRAANPRLITMSISGYGLEGPMAHRPVLDPVIQAISGQVAHQVNPEAPLTEVVGQEQVVANDSVIEFDDPAAGRTLHPRPPARFAVSGTEPDWHAPLLGEHTDEILAEAGLDPAAVAELRAARVVH